ncbi:hypothetical protein NLG97_g8815 [Lecanicillium saksenae]|uniref:Uncharacterized protein n=1 Tax=Lecanicillium saksenae TaxID=468837 RepID=A0ACC1QHT3_9HYPO|nr:hypothetical protein NLG97_g8815 [Lecanicillium saksenae]
MVQKLAYISGKELQYLPHKALSKVLIYAYAGNLINNQIMPHVSPPSTPSPSDDPSSQDPGDQDDEGFQVGQGSQGDPLYEGPPQQGIPNNQYTACRFGCPDCAYANPGWNYRGGGQANNVGAAPAMAYQANAPANAAPAGPPSAILVAPASVAAHGGDNRPVAAKPVGVGERKKVPWIKRVFLGRSKSA